MIIYYDGSYACSCYLWQTMDEILWLICSAVGLEDPALLQLELVTFHDISSLRR